MEEFFCRTKILAGSGAAEKLGELGAKRVFLVSDPFFEKNGTARKIGEQTKAEQIHIFSDVRPDPSVELAAEGTARLRAFDPDLIIALGGGSAMDCAKAMAFFAGNGAKLVAIPTTSGSGSEVTDFAILTHNGVKHPLVDRKLRPSMAVLDSDLLQQLPSSLVADAGFDVLSHALEALAATGAGAITDALARDAFCKAFSRLPRSFSGDKSVRLEVHLAATMAGMAFSQAGLGLCHALSHSLGGAFHVPHGRLNAILLPAVVAFNAPRAGKKYADLARMADLGGSAEQIAVRNLKNGLIRLRRELKLPQTLAEAGIASGELRKKSDQIVQAVLDDPCCRTNPVPVTGADVRRILQEVSGG